MIGCSHLNGLLVLLRLLNPPRRRARWPLKSCFLAAVVLFTLYPNPLLLGRHLRHWSNLEAMIQPEEPALAPLVQEAESRLSANPDKQSDPEFMLRTVERVVYERIPYAWDWDVWGCADYLPTVAETLRQGREDCDGRAVVAASILRRLGIQASLVTDGSHMWIQTGQGDAMSPMPTASGRTLISSVDGGARVDPFAIVGVRAILIDWPKNLGFGAAVFPIGRVACIALAVLVCLLPTGARTARCTFASICVAGALLSWRLGCSDPWDNSLGAAWLGIGGCVLGCVIAGRGGTVRGITDSAHPPPNPQ